jgi:carboxypeptidase C (cathepsin A)
MTTTLLSRFFITLTAAVMTSVYHFTSSRFLHHRTTTTSSVNTNAVIHPELVPLEGASRKKHDQHDHHEEEELLLRRGLITHLPGLDYDPGFRQYSGYLTVSEEHGRNIFYWYVESQHHPSTDPVVLWSNGGPGCSGLIGLLREHGPYLLNDKLQLSPNPYSWNKVANVLYIEQPALVGFSYSETPSDYYTNDRKAAVDNYQLILEFFKRYPERQSNDFYIASESYGGHYMPQREYISSSSSSYQQVMFVGVCVCVVTLCFVLTHIIHVRLSIIVALQILQQQQPQNSSSSNHTDDAAAAADVLIKNFKGVLIGNPFVDPFSNAQAEIGSYYSHGLLPGPLYQQWVELCNSHDTFGTEVCAYVVCMLCNSSMDR